MEINVSFPSLSILGIAFIILKLCNVIDWAWIWVLAPFWIPLAIIGIILIVWLIIVIVLAIIAMIAP